MIKRYNQFVNDRINENVDEFEDEIPMNSEDFEEQPSVGQEISDDEIIEIDSDLDSEEEEMEEEGGDVYTAKLQEVAGKLGSEVVNGKVEYNGKKIIFPSETEMYHVDNKKFKTSDEVVSYLDSNVNADLEAGEMENDNYPGDISGEEADLEADIMDEDERYSAMKESKSYKNTRKFK